MIKWNLNYTTLILLQNKNDNGDGYAMEPLVEKYVKFFRSILHRNNYYFSKFIFCEFLNVVSLYANFYLTDVFLNGNFWYYGYEAVKFSRLPYQQQVTLMWQFWPSCVELRIFVIVFFRQALKITKVNKGSKFNNQYQYSTPILTLQIWHDPRINTLCRNDELSSMMSWTSCLLTDSELFVLFAEIAKLSSKFQLFPFS